MPTVRHVAPELTPRSLARRRTLSSLSLRVPLPFSLRKLVGTGPRCEPAEITGSLLRPPAANPKEANAMSGARLLRINTGHRKRGEILRTNGSRIYRSEKKNEREKDRNKKLPITNAAASQPFKIPRRPTRNIRSRDTDISRRRRIRRQRRR